MTGRALLLHESPAARFVYFGAIKMETLDLHVLQKTSRMCLAPTFYGSLQT